MACLRSSPSAEPKTDRTGMSQWPELPEETRQALTVLIVRLFVDQANCERTSQQKGAGHDA
ncbi:hypothetical protein ACC848_42090 [Rhizobium johnstonii]